MKTNAKLLFKERILEKLCGHIILVYVFLIFLAMFSFKPPLKDENF